VWVLSPPWVQIPPVPPFKYPVNPVFTGFFGSPTLDNLAAIWPKLGPDFLREATPELKLVDAYKQGAIIQGDLKNVLASIERRNAQYLRAQGYGECARTICSAGHVGPYLRR
jgi:hypothetical protein